MKNEIIPVSYTHLTQVKLLEKNESWYKIQYGSYKGWAKAECLTYINPESENSADSDVTYSKAELLSKLNFDMPLNEPSGCLLYTSRCV